MAGCSFFAKPTLLSNIANLRKGLYEYSKVSFNIHNCKHRAAQSRQLWSFGDIQKARSSHCVNRLTASISCIPDTSKRFSTPTKNVNQSDASERDSIFCTLTMKLEQIGRLYSSDIKRALRTLELVDTTVEQCTRLLEMTLKMVEGECRPCGGIICRVWALVYERIGASLEHKHLEAYLRMCLLDGVPISHKEILQLMEVHKMDLSSEISELMMLIMGHHGDEEGVTDLLSLMKSQNLAITETIFSALIYAYGVNRDLDSVNSVLDTMQSAQVKFTGTTLAALLTAYGLSGKLSEMKEVFTNMTKFEVVLTHSQLCSLLLTLVKHKQVGSDYKILNYVLELFEISVRKIDLSKVALQMISSGHVREAVHVLQSHPPLRSRNHLYSNGLMYIREMVNANVAPELLIEMCLELKRVKINDFAFEVALESALLEHREDLALTLMKAIRENGGPIRQHYFWPLFHHYALNRESKKLIDCVKKMVDIGIIPDQETLLDHVIPGVNISHPALTIQMLKDAGVSASAAATPMLRVLLKNNMIDLAENFVKEAETPLILRDLTMSLAHAWPRHPQAITSLFAYLIRMNHEDHKEDATTDWGGQFVLDLASTRVGLSQDVIPHLFKELNKNGIGISETALDLLINRSNQAIQKAIQSNAHLVLNPDLGYPPNAPELNTLPHRHSMSKEQLEGHLAELEAKKLNIRGSLRHLLLLHASSNETDKVIALMKKAKEENIKLSGGMLASLLGTYTKIRNTNAALEMYTTIKTENPQFELDCFKVIDLCKLLIEDAKSSEAVDVLEEYILESEKQPERKGVRRNCIELLMAAASTCDYELTKKIYSLLLDGDLIAEKDKICLGALIKCKLNSGDMTGALDEVEAVFTSHRFLPMKTDILIHLLHHAKHCESSSDTDYGLLQRMVNLIEQFYGSSVRAHHDLMFACLEAGYPLDAKKVLKNLPKVYKKTVLKQCERYSKLQQDVPLLHFLSASRGNVNVDRHTVFMALLNIYYVQNAGEKGLSLWTAMQEDDLTASDEFLSTLTSLLVANNIKVPYQIS